MITPIMEVNNPKCIGGFKSRNIKLDTIARKMFGGEMHKLFSKSKKDGIPDMKRQFVRYAYRFDSITQVMLGEYLGHKDHATVNHYLHKN